MIAIQLACGIAAALCLAVLLMRGGLLGGCLLLVLAASCFGHPFFFIPAYPIPITADRALLAGLVLQYLLYRRLGNPSVSLRPPLALVDWLLAGLLVVILLSTFSHDWSVDNNQPVSDVLFQFLMPSAVYWVARQSVVTRWQIKWLLGGLAVFGLYLSFTAFCEVQGIWSGVWPSYIGNATKYKEYFGRGRGPFLDPTANGLVITAALIAALMAWPHLERKGRLAIMLAAPVYTAGLFFTLTRSVWMGAVGALVVVAAATVPRAWRWRLVGIATLGALLVTTTNWELLVAFKRDRDVSASEVRDSVQLRPILAMVAWKMFCDRPLLGCGFGQYERQCIYYLADRSTNLQLEKARKYVQHNTLLALLTETGIVGVGLFVGVLGIWTRNAWRLWRQATAPLWARQVGLLFVATIAAYVANAMFHDLLMTPAVTMLLGLTAGAIVSLQVQCSRFPPSKSQPSAPAHQEHDQPIAARQLQPAS